MRSILIISFVVALVAFLGVMGYILLWPRQDAITSPVIEEVREKVFPLNKYSFKNLSELEFVGNEIEIGRQIEEDDPDFDMYMFYFSAEDPVDKSDVGRVSGLLTVPTQEGEYPVIVQLRGYVDREIYDTGVGTARSAQEYAKAGFISLSPDFLGYGESDNPSEKPIEERLQTYSTVLSLLASLKNLNKALEEKNLVTTANASQLGMWGHSNGGHIALAVLAITKRPIPTVLWAPVSKPFPYSILYFTDEFVDEGKALRKVVAEFEREYDVFDFSPSRYYDQITAPLQIHQGGFDDAVPVGWTNELVDNLNELEVENEYFVYPGADHNLLGGWNDAVARSTEFYRTHLVNN